MKLFAMLLLWSGFCFADKGKLYFQNEAPLVYEKGAATRVFVLIPFGQIVVTPSGKSNEISVRFTKNLDFVNDNSPGASADPYEILKQVSLRSQIVGDTFDLRVLYPPTKVEWGRYVEEKNVPKVRVELQAPDNLNLELYVHTGDVKVAKWKGYVAIKNHKGNINIEGIANNVNVHQMFGQIKVDDIKSDIELDSFNSQINVSQVGGKLKLKTFGGDNNIKKVKGGISVSTQKGPVTISDTSGNADIFTAFGTVKISDHKGLLRGVSEAGLIDAKITGTADVKLNSDSGTLKLLISKSGAGSVNLVSKKGEIGAPSSLESKRFGDLKSVKGQLSDGDGKVKMTSESGNIYLKTL